MRILINKSYWDGGQDYIITRYDVYDVNSELEFRKVDIKIPEGKFVDFDAEDEPFTEVIKATYADVFNGAYFEELYEFARNNEPLYFQYKEEREEFETSKIAYNYLKATVEHRKDPSKPIPPEISKPYLEFFHRWSDERRKEFKEIDDRVIEKTVVYEKDPNCITFNEFIKMFNIDKVL